MGRRGTRFGLPAPTQKLNRSRAENRRSRGGPAVFAAGPVRHPFPRHRHQVVLPFLLPHLRPRPTSRGRALLGRRGGPVRRRGVIGPRGHPRPHEVGEAPTSHLQQPGSGNQRWTCVGSRTGQRSGAYGPDAHPTKTRDSAPRHGTPLPERLAGCRKVERGMALRLGRVECRHGVWLGRADARRGEGEQRRLAADRSAVPTAAAVCRALRRIPVAAAVCRGHARDNRRRLATAPGRNPAPMARLDGPLAAVAGKAQARNPLPEPPRELHATSGPARTRSAGTLVPACGGESHLSPITLSPACGGQGRPNSISLFFPCRREGRVNSASLAPACGGEGWGEGARFVERRPG